MEHTYIPIDLKSYYASAECAARHPDPLTTNLVVADYKPGTNSISEGQVLSEPYSNDKAKIIVKEMADSLALQLLAKRLATDGLVLYVGYDRENCDKSGYTGPVHIDRYGRKVPRKFTLCSC